MIRLALTLSVIASAATLAGAQTIYAEDFSNGAPGWTVVTTLGHGVTWRTDALPASTPNGPFHSSPASLNFNNDVDYNGGSGTATADSPPIDLSLATGTPVLTFWCNDQMVEGTCDPHERTTLYVVGHFSWQLGFNPDSVCNISCPKFTWHPHSFPLQPAWSVVQIRFEVRTDGLFDNQPGWFIDDFAVIDSPAPVTYCTAKQTSAFCTPDSAWGGALPSVSSREACTLSCSGVSTNQSGMFFYGLSGPAAVFFLGGTLCIAAPVKRTFVQSSNGNFGCAGYFSLDFNSWIQSGTDPFLVPGQGVNGQWWFRDPNATFDSGLSDGIELVVQP